ncbi:MAG: SurA N-terminal domain-containing protein [Firmicutes bacterium]|nr:SurA N-terminal domain-containing protein [Bacillota bacterium]
MKKRNLIIGIAGILFIIMVSAAAFTQTQFLKIGQDIKSIKADEKAKKVVAKVNGEAIDWQTFKVEQYVRNQGSNEPATPKPSGEAVIKEVAKKKLLAKEAKRRGIVVSDSEVKTMMLNIKKAIAGMPSEEQQRFKDYLVGLGMSETEFWSNPEVINAYKEALYIGKLRGEFLKGAKTQEEVEKAESEYNKLGDSLLEAAKIEITNPETIK